MTYELAELQYAPPANIGCSFAMPDPRVTQEAYVLVISFEGT